MENKVRELLDEVIIDKVESLKNLQGDERDKAIEELANIHKMRIEEEKIEVSRTESENEKQLKLDERKSQNLNQWVNIGIQAGLTIGSWIAFTLWQRSEQKFEQTGTPSTPIFRNLLSRMTPNLKK